MARPWAGRLFLDAGTTLFIGPGGAADRHAHHAVQLVWARAGTLSLTLDRSVRRRAALIAADTPHAFDASGADLALMLVDPHGARGRALHRRARAHPTADVAAALERVGFPAATITPDDATAWCDAAAAALGADEPGPALSAVSRRAIAFIEAHLDGTPRLTDAARHLGLSATRLTHVFSREVGIPFRRYVRWARILRAVAATQDGADLTAAALAAGFSDSAHLSRTFRATVGLSPSAVLATATFKRPARARRTMAP